MQWQLQLEQYPTSTDTGWDERMRSTSDGTRHGPNAKIFLIEVHSNSFAISRARKPGRGDLQLSGDAEATDLELCLEAHYRQISKNSPF